MGGSRARGVRRVVRALSALADARVPPRHGTFVDDRRSRCRALAALGFDVVYLAPIHPIGRTFRKGKNNSLAAGAG